MHFSLVGKFLLQLISSTGMFVYKYKRLGCLGQRSCSSTCFWKVRVSCQRLGGSFYLLCFVLSEFSLYDRMMMRVILRILVKNLFQNGA